jgi:predicted GNAT family acetyltransferase
MDRLGKEASMSAEPIVIEHEESAGRGAFFVEREGVRLGEMTYSRVDARKIIVDHTEVHESLRGLGLARKLLDSLVAWARESNTRVAATCPYALAQFQKDAAIRDVYEA